MNRAVGLMLLAAVAGCQLMQSDSSTHSRTTGEGRVRSLDTVAVEELTAAFKADPVAAAERYREVRWRFRAAVRWVGTGTAAGTVTAFIDDLGECSLRMRDAAGITATQVGQNWEFLATVSQFDPATVGGLTFHDAERLGHKAPNMMDDSGVPSHGGRKGGGQRTGQPGSMSGPGPWGS